MDNLINSYLFVNSTWYIYIYIYIYIYKLPISDYFIAAPWIRSLFPHLAGHRPGQWLSFIFEHSMFRVPKVAGLGVGAPKKNHLHWIWQHNLKSLEQTTERTALKGQPAFHSVPHTCKAVANHYHLMATHSIEYQAMSGPSKKPAEKKALKVQFSVGHLEYFDESTSYSSILYTVYLHNLVYLVSSFNLTLYCLTSAQVHIASAQAATWSTWRSMLEGSGQPCWRLRCRSH